MVEVGRREWLQLCTTGALGLILPGSLRAAPYRTIPQKPSLRMIVDNDFAGDPDGLVALAHQLLHPKIRSVLVTSSPLDPKFPGPVPAGQTARRGAELARELIARIGSRTAPQVMAGPEKFGSFEPGAAARAIVTEAMRDDPLPLTLACGGPLTNVAAALRLEPAIASRMTVIWIGGGAYPSGAWEYNLAADPEAAHEVIERSAVPLWQVPQNAYRQMQYSVAELRAEMRGASPLGEWLYDQFTSPPDFFDLGGSWPLGDSPPVLLAAISAESSRAVERPARRILPDLTYGNEIAGRKVQVYETLDARLTFGDFIALLKLHGRGEL